jgi:hypothetical protein
MEDARYILGTLLIVSSLIKVVNWREFLHYFRETNIIASKYSFYAILFVAAELLLGSAYYIFFSITFTTFLVLLFACTHVFSIAKRGIGKTSTFSFRTISVTQSRSLLAFTLSGEVIMSLVALVILLLL